MTDDHAALLHSLTRWISDEILEGEGEDLRPDTPLLELGILNSIEVGRLLAFIEREHGVRVPLTAIRPATVATLTAIVGMVAAVRAGAAGAA